MRFHRNTTHRVGCICLVAVLLGACGTSPKQIDRLSGPKVVDVLQGVGPNGSRKSTESVVVNNEWMVERDKGSFASDHEVYTRRSVNEIRQLFPTLPNPTIPLFVHAHPVAEPSTGEILPVPGYTTAFTLYQRVEYALPGELPPSRVNQTDQFPTDAKNGEHAPFWDTTQAK